MKITLAQSKPKTHTKSMLAVGAGIAALATYVASHKVHREKLMNIVSQVKDKWNDFIASAEAEIEFDASKAKKIAKRKLRQKLND